MPQPSSPTDQPSDCRRAPQSVLLGVTTVFLAIMTSACGIFLPGSTSGSCDEPDCDLACDTYALDAEGCALCECAVPDVTVCWDDSECGDGSRCDTENYCETPPGCADGEPCPAVCYGRCVEGSDSCFSDADCGPGEICRAPQAPAEAPCFEGDPNCGDDVRLAPEGICVDAGCENDPIDLPACPPNTRPVFDPQNCGNVRCVEVDSCRDLSIDQCEQVDGCGLVTLPSPCTCEGGTGNEEPACDCPQGEQVCAPVRNGCFGLTPEECDERDDCEGFWAGAGARPAPPACDCAPDDQDCGCEQDPIVEEFYCTDRRPFEGCLDGSDCGPNERCEIQVICTDDCYEAEDGSSGCISECWETGQCVSTDRSCYELTAEECTQDPDCQPIDYGCNCAPNDQGCDCAALPVAIYCEPRPRASCLGDNDCGPNETCAIEEWCPPCVDGSDPSCFAPCWVEGRCVEGGPEPTRCSNDDQCGNGFVCEVLTVCEESNCTGADPGPGERPAPPPPPDCDQFCYEEGRCVPESRPAECFGDFDCDEGSYCALYDNCIGPPDCVDCLIACSGQCRPIAVEPGYCITDADCENGTVCAVDQEVCFIDPAGNSNECFHECVAPEPTTEGLCLEDADCREGQRCATDTDECACPANEPNCAVCYSRCIDDGVCDQVITGARAPGSNECEAFPTPCDVPQGYELCDLAP